MENKLTSLKNMATNQVFKETQRMINLKLKERWTKKNNKCHGKKNVRS